MFGFFKTKPEPDRQPSHSFHVPEDVESFFTRARSLNDPALLINILEPASSAAYTESLRGIPVANRLGLIALDDANDSNPYCLITNGPASGMVVHFSHDPEPKIEFLSLDAFEAFLVKLHEQRACIFEMDAPLVSHPDQSLLDASILSLIDEQPSDEVEFLICLYLPLLRGDHAYLLARLATYDNFLVREAVAEAIGSAGLSGSKEILVKLTGDLHPQVQSAAVRALKLKELGSSHGA